MKILHKWRQQVDVTHAADEVREIKLGIVSNEPKSVSPADIERLEEQMVPWLREKRRLARQRKGT